MKPYNLLRILMLGAVCSAFPSFATPGGSPKGPGTPPTASVPEPSTIGVYLLGAVLAGTLANRRMQRNKSTRDPR